MKKTIFGVVFGFLVAVSVSALAYIGGGISNHNHSGSGSGGDLRATQAQVDAGTATTVFLSPSVRRTTILAPVATTSGTSVDITGIPAGVREVTLHFNSVSSSGVSSYLVQLGTSGGIEATGYIGGAFTLSSDLISAAGFICQSAAVAARIYSGHITFKLAKTATNTWTGVGGLFPELVTTTTGTCIAAKSLSGTLDRIRLTTIGGTDTFDAGEIAVSYSF